MAKDFRYQELFEAYKSMLTERQAQIFKEYYELDLSFAEIAEEKGTTRQSVSDALKKARAELDALEARLGVCAKQRAVLDVAERLRQNEQTQAFAKELDSIFGE